MSCPYKERWRRNVAATKAREGRAEARPYTGKTRRAGLKPGLYRRERDGEKRKLGSVADGGGMEEMPFGGGK